MKDRFNDDLSAAISKVPLERWVEHYSELYSRVNVVSDEALMAMECLSIMDELDSEPTLEEIN